MRSKNPHPNSESCVSAHLGPSPCPRPSFYGNRASGRGTDQPQPQSWPVPDWQTTTQGS